MDGFETTRGKYKLKNRTGGKKKRKNCPGEHKGTDIKKNAHQWTGGNERPG
jgi:hypothetical protein